MKRNELKTNYTSKKDEGRRNFALNYIANHIKKNLQNLSKFKWGGGGFACFVNLERPHSEQEGQDKSK
ncbi:MAG: hypothetical protein A2599_02800 [Candidatus Staskawiczbacteria bacterium RIFOXYD1_FULL_39_28]|uniref:Uncharacterized protein n=1 Tax=Candidatus Staskawiczbacteria bacterium RIFOXYC1_FULL_38_18 TaxID=1802229 RepID=A0A1G2JBZ5_9BACT|nr:MAG: hypothetical protein A2401_01300 [Candidatus Staskawiczbacteria bacterium RIFOXYC1_FULL_38_18]OGZ91039.1 MAG: hypothetical protein A2599_02800 [Candidatus Staskawiczbacteria bacterium RIFOXYD1_FULL_39_28]